jgi:hypothetical protein
MIEEDYRTRLKQELALKEVIRIELNQKLETLFNSIHNAVNKPEVIIFLDKETQGPKEKSFQTDKNYKDIFKRYLAGETCEILFEKNEKGSFLISISKDKSSNNGRFSLEMMSLTEDQGLREASITCDPSRDNPDDLFIYVKSRKQSVSPRYQYKDLERQRHDSLGLIRLAGIIANRSGLI